MNQIADFKLPWLENAAHFQFMSEVHHLIDKYLQDVLQIDHLFEIFQKALQREADILKVDKECKQSKLVYDCDQRCERTWRAIIDKVKAYLLSPYPHEVENAQKIQQVLDLYSDLHYSSLIKHSTLIEGLIADLEKDENILQVQLLGLTDWVMELKTQNQSFQSVLEERNIEIRGRENGDPRLIRVESDLLYKEIVNKVNAFFTLKIATSSAELFASELNLMIKNYQSKDPSRQLIHTMHVEMV